MATTTASIPVNASRDQDDILALVKTLHKAHYDKDANSIAAAYTADAEIYSLAPPLVHRGISLQEKRAWLDTWDGPIELALNNFKATVSGDFAFCHYFKELSGSPKAAGRRISFWMRSTVCLRREGGAWHIVHEHESVPFYMDGSLRPAFDLKP
jgi:ketosteroid isomerase-like protein